MNTKEIMNDVAEALWLKPSKKQQDKRYSEAIESIHKEFNEAFRVNLENANETLKQSEDEKGGRLARSGFKSTEKGSKYIESKRAKEKALKDANTILYYNQTYPMNKFIFGHDVIKICDKYNLFSGKVSLFTGFVPEKNLKEIENFRIHDEDRRDNDHTLVHESKEDNYFVQSTQLQIVAPLKDFDLEGYHTEGREIVKDAPPDPIVLFPVKNGFLIVTAWGDEASDPIVQNPNHS